MTAGNTSTTVAAGPTENADLGETADFMATADPDETALLSRRKVFAAGSAGVLALGLAACGSGSSGSSSGSSGGTGSSAGDPPAATATGGAAAGASASLTKVDAVPVGGAIGVTVSGKPVIVSQPTKGNVVAFSAICPHQGCTVAASGSQSLSCPCHGSTFDPKTGKNLAGPANGTPLTPVAVEVTNGEVTLKA